MKILFVYPGVLGRHEVGQLLGHGEPQVKVLLTHSEFSLFNCSMGVFENTKILERFFINFWTLFSEARQNLHSEIC